MNLSISLEILIKPIDIPYVLGIRVIAVTHTNGRAVYIVDIDNYFIACNLGYEFIAVIVISGNYAVFSFANQKSAQRGLYTPLCAYFMFLTTRGKTSASIMIIAPIYNRVNRCLYSWTVRGGDM